MTCPRLRNQNQNFRNIVKILKYLLTQDLSHVSVYENSTCAGQPVEFYKYKTFWVTPLGILKFDTGGVFYFTKTEFKNYGYDKLHPVNALNVLKSWKNSSFNDELYRLGMIRKHLHNLPLGYEKILTCLMYDGGHGSICRFVDMQLRSFEYVNTMLDETYSLDDTDYQDRNFYCQVKTITTAQDNKANKVIRYVLRNFKSTAVMETAATHNDASAFKYKTLWITPYGVLKLDSGGASILNKNQFKHFEECPLFKFVNPLDVINNWDGRLRNFRQIEASIIERALGTAKPFISDEEAIKQASDIPYFGATSRN